MAFLIFDPFLSVKSGNYPTSFRQGIISKKNRIISTRITRLQPNNSRTKLNKRYKLVIQWNHKYNNPKLSNSTIIKPRYQINRIGYLARGPRESRSSCSWIMIFLVLGFLLHRPDVASWISWCMWTVQACGIGGQQMCEAWAASIGEGGRLAIVRD